MLVGPLEAEYVGNDQCLKACHEHDQSADNLRLSVHGQQKESGSGMPLVNCETCHGPGSLAVAHAEENKKCDTAQFIQIKELPAVAQSLLCLKCHSSHSTANMQFWSGSRHDLGDISCFGCHKLHAGPEQKIRGEAVNDLCNECHPAVKASFSYWSRHPVKEGRMNCSSCHSPHGSLNPLGLKATDMKGLCLECHAEKTGPYIFEHDDVTDDCSNCHSPHGSPFRGLLRYSEPFLCLQCHTGHTDLENPLTPSVGYKRGLNTRCTNCHSQIHGTDSTGPSGRALIE